MTDKPSSEPKRHQCSVCGFDNPEGVLNCQNCGTPLVPRNFADVRKAAEPISGEKPAEKPAGATTNPSAPQPAKPTTPQPPATLSSTAPTEPTLKPAAASPAPAPGPAPQPATPPAQPSSPIEQPPGAASPPVAATVRSTDETAPSEVGTNQFTRPTQCPRCGHYNRPGMLVCDNCGTNLATGEHPKFTTASLGDQLAKTRLNTGVETGTKPLGDQPKIVPHLSTEEIRAVQTAGADLFEDDMILRLEVSGAPTPILVYPTAETIIGRRDPISSGVPDVDLTAYAGYRMGVSRQHAVLRLQSKVLDIRDLGSSNGTFVNGIRLSPHQPHLLRDGDEIGLGKMVLKVFFQSGARRKSTIE